MSNDLRTFISIVDHKYDGIVEELFLGELDKCSPEELGKIKQALDRCSKEIQNQILERHLENAYDKGFEDGKTSAVVGKAYDKRLR